MSLEALKAARAELDKAIAAGEPEPPRTYEVAVAPGNGQVPTSTVGGLRSHEAFRLAIDHLAGFVTEPGPICIHIEPEEGTP